MGRVRDAYDLDSALEDGRSNYLSANADGGDAVAIDTTAPVNTVREVLGKTTICVSCTLSVAAATVEVACLTYITGNDGVRHLLGVQTATATASSYTLSSRYVAGLLFFDVGGANEYELRFADPSSGNVMAKAWET